jgi:AcrR family transcriptional regulator
MIARDAARVAVVESLATHLLAAGLAQSSLRQLAAAAGISDRMLLYYFKDKTEVLASAMGQVTATLAQTLDAVVPAGTRLPPGALAARAAGLAVAPATRPFMRLWIEVVAAAAKAEAPFPAIAGQISTGFFDWIEDRIDLPPGPARTHTATLLLALVDGLALVAVCAPDRAEAAAASAGALWAAADG